ncbi:MAG: GreA/GreB family elongation factor [Ghiorsea sp.]
MQKQQVLILIISQLEADIAVAEQAVSVARDTATHKDCLGASKYETMGTEAAYLAQGQGLRLLELERSLAYFKQCNVEPCASIGLSSLFILEDERGKQQHFWLAADAGGLKISYHELLITVITPQSPLGRGLLGKAVGDDVSIKIAATSHDYEIIRVS